MADLTPLLAFRWSPRAFDPEAELTGSEAATLLEAARWAPSAENGQPWRFVLGYRHDEVWKRILVNLLAEDQSWAGHASALLVGGHVAPDPERAAYDLGQAVAHLTVQAAALGFYVHQLVRFDRTGLETDLDLSAEARLLVVVAVGRLGDPFRLPDDLRRREIGLRHRRPLADLMLR